MDNQNTNLKKGFTLIEMLVSIALLGMLLVALLALQWMISQNQIAAWRSYTSIDEANLSVASLVREIRNARNADNGAYVVELGNDNQLVFYSDVDFDGDTEKVRYYLDGSNFVRGVIEPVGYPVSYPSDQEKTRYLSENIRNGETAVFTYYNGDWPQDTINNPLSTPASPAEIKLVKIYLVINTTSNQPESDYFLESFAQVRMIKDNL